MSEKYSAWSALGEIAKGGGNYFAAIGAEKVRAERLAQARAERREDIQLQDDLAKNRLEEQRAYNENRAGEVVRGSFTGEDGTRIQEMQDGTLVRTGVKVKADQGIPASARMARDTRKDLAQRMDKIDYIGTRESLVKLKHALDSKNSIADTSAVFYYMKTLDPTSVVRESEFKTVKDARAFIARSEEKGIPVPTRVVQMVQSLEGKGFLTQEMRDQIFAESQAAFAEKQRNADMIMQSFEPTIAKYGLDPIEIGLHLYRGNDLLAEQSETTMPIEESPMAPVESAEPIEERRRSVREQRRGMRAPLNGLSQDALDMLNNI